MKRVWRWAALAWMPVLAAAADVPQAGPATASGKEALDVLQRSVAFRTVAGEGQVPSYAAFLKERLVAAGFAPDEVRFTPVGETGYLTARYPGRDRAAKPIVLLAHMDVVPARREDWARDPFKPVVENGYIYGRGALDNKADLSVVVATLAKLRRSGWTPARDIVLALSGDEETQMATTQRLAEELRGAELVLNADAGGGLLGEDGKPIVFRVQAGEKTYADYTLTVTDPGGHSSRPGPNNAIYRLAAGLGRLAAHRFPAQASPLTRAYMRASAPRTPGPAGAAMRAFAADPTDTRAADILSADPEYVGLVRTTCVATMITGGHAPNALPQEAKATVNCRIFPGVGMAETQAELARVLADPVIKVAYVDSGTLAAPESPLRPDVLRAITNAVHARAPGLPIVPSMESGATDSMHFRARGVPAYGVSSVFLKPSDDFAHGLNERLPLATLDAGVRQWETLLRGIAG